MFNSSIMATIKYLLQSKAESAPIYLRLSNGRNNTFYRKTGLNINFKDWSDKKGFPIGKDANTKNLQSKLLHLKSSVLDELNEANSNAINVDGSWLSFEIDVFFGRTNRDNQSDLLLDAIQDIIDNANTRKNSKGGIGLSKSRVNSYKSLQSILNGYLKKRQTKVKDVNKLFARNFLRYLLEEKKYQMSTSMKKIADLKTVCFDAEGNGIETHHQLKKIESTKSTNDNIIYLNIEELKLIEEVDIYSPSLNNVRKWLLLGCNIGQRVSDLLNISESNIVNRKGLDVIELKQQKTGKFVTIPVLETTKKILDDGFPYKISAQKFNKYVKGLCREAGINNIIEGSKVQVLEEGKGNRLKRKITGKFQKWELIGSHCCRRSFASNLYGILPTPLIMNITAHSTERSLNNYIGKQGLDYAQQIADFYELQKLKAIKEPQLKVIKEAN